MNRKSGGRCPFARVRFSLLTKGYCDYNWWYQIQLFRGLAVRAHDSRVTPGFNLEEDKKPCSIPSKPQNSVRITFSASNHLVPAANASNEYYGNPVAKRTCGGEKTAARVGLLATNDLETQVPHHAERLQSALGQLSCSSNGWKQNLKIRKFLGRQRKWPLKVQILPLDHLLLRANETRHSVLIQVLATA